MDYKYLYSRRAASDEIDDSERCGSLVSTKHVMIMLSGIDRLISVPQVRKIIALMIGRLENVSW